MLILVLILFLYIQNGYKMTTQIKNLERLSEIPAWLWDNIVESMTSPKFGLPVNSAYINKVVKWDDLSNETMFYAILKVAVIFDELKESEWRYIRVYASKSAGCANVSHSNTCSISFD